MNGQLNSNIYNASNNEADIEELQKQIDSLNTSVGSISEKLDKTTEALNEYKAENNNQISTAEIISTSATVDNLSSNTINGTTLCINGTSNQKDINAEDICATGMTQIIYRIFIASDKSTNTCKALRESSHYKIHFVRYAKMIANTPTLFSEDAETMGLINHQ